MATIKHSTPDTTGGTTILSGAPLQNVTTGAYTSACSSAVDNSSGLYLYADVAFSSTATSGLPLAGGYVAVYLLPKIDGTLPVSGTTATGPGEGYLWAALPMAPVSGSAYHAGAYNIPIPPCEFVLTLGNFTGVAFPNDTANLLKIRRHNIDVS